MGPPGAPGEVPGCAGPASGLCTWRLAHEDAAGPGPVLQGDPPAARIRKARAGPGILYLATLVLIVFSVAPSEFSIFKIMLSENRGGFASSSSMQMPFISYFLLLLWPWLELPVQCQIAVVRMDILSHGQKRWWVKWKPLVPEHSSKKWSTWTF